MAEIVAPAMPVKDQRYRLVCAGCKCQFTFASSEVERRMDGAPMVYCSVTCPGCHSRVRWNEPQTLPVAIRDDETPLPTITGAGA